MLWIPQPVRTPTGPGFSRAEPEPDPSLQGGLGLGFERPEPSQAEPEPGLSSPARARKTLVEGHWVRELVDHGEVEITYVKSAENIADVLTKALPLTQHKFLIHKLGML
jgi:hypothetical protein